MTVENNFRLELARLLAKHKATLSMEYDRYYGRYVLSVDIDDISTGNELATIHTGDTYADVDATDITKSITSE
jgi:hypothetical protein